MIDDATPQKPGANGIALNTIQTGIDTLPIKIEAKQALEQIRDEGPVRITPQVMALVNAKLARAEGRPAEAEVEMHDKGGDAVGQMLVANIERHPDELRQAASTLVAGQHVNVDALLDRIKAGKAEMQGSQAPALSFDRGQKMLIEGSIAVSRAEQTLAAALQQGVERAIVISPPSFPAQTAPAEKKHR